MYSNRNKENIMGATQEQIEWLKAIPEYENMADTIGKYDDTYDYVGPDDWRRKLIPRYIYGADVNVCAYIHDYRYAVGGSEADRLQADTMFFGNMMKWVENKKFPWGINAFIKYFARKIVYKYYSVVRLLGSSSFNFHNK